MIGRLSIKLFNSRWFQLFVIGTFIGFTTLRSYQQFKITLRRIPRNTALSTRFPASYLRMCSEILSSSPSSSTSFIEEEEIVCNSMDFHNALMNIFASSFIASQLRGSEVHYDHGCSTISKRNPDAIQNYLDAKIMFPAITQNLAHDLCVRCKTAECILFSDQAYKDAVLDTISNNLDKTLKNYASVKGRVVQALDVASHSAAIVLAGGTCYDNLEHFHLYPQEIPRSIDSIFVLYSESFRAACEKQCSRDKIHSLSHSDCFYGFRLMKYLKNFFGKRVLTYDQASSIEMFYKIKRSSYFICPTHDQCLFPSLASNHYSSLIGKESKEGSSNVATWLQGRNNTIIVDSKFRDGACRYLSGKKGRWDYDLDAAKSFQYTLDLNHYFGTAQLEYNATKEMPYRPSTTYKWTEQNFPKCKLSYLSLDGICNIMWNLKMQRIMFVGDSLQFNMAQAFWKIIDQNDTIIDHYRGKFTCTVAKNDRPYPVELVFIRNDQLIENDLPVDPVKQIKNCNAYCLPWTDVYNSTPKNTLLILNTGSHLGQLKVFKETMDNVLQKIDSYHRNNDIVFIRTTAPGHEDCQKYDAPFPNHESYLATNPTKEHFYKWDKFSLYNDHLATILDTRRRERLQKKPLSDTTPQTELLDIFYMTVLRPDGHISGPECTNERCRTKIDCLHYNLPGPLDWWNHLLFSHLQNVMEEHKLERALNKPYNPLAYLNN